MKVEGQSREHVQFWSLRPCMLGMKSVMKIQSKKCQTWADLSNDQVLQGRRCDEDPVKPDSGTTRGWKDFSVSGFIDFSSVFDCFEAQIVTGRLDHQQHWSWYGSDVLSSIFFNEYQNHYTRHHLIKWLVIAAMILIMACRVVNVGHQCVQPERTVEGISPGWVL